MWQCTMCGVCAARGDAAGEGVVERERAEEGLEHEDERRDRRRLLAEGAHEVARGETRVHLPDGDGDVDGHSGHRLQLEHLCATHKCTASAVRRGEVRGVGGSALRVGRLMSTGIRAESTSFCEATHGCWVRSSLRCLSAEPTPDGGHEISSSTTSMSDDESASPCEQREGVR